ncbi:hypothetical protein Dimus_030816, partial [Dionaea muscipula]
IWGQWRQGPLLTGVKQMKPRSAARIAHNHRQTALAELLIARPELQLLAFGLIGASDLIKDREGDLIHGKHRPRAANRVACDAGLRCPVRYYARLTRLGTRWSLGGASGGTAKGPNPRF